MSGSDCDNVPAADNHLFKIEAAGEGHEDITTVKRKKFLNNKSCRQ
jgi:hypothetical protein